MTGDLQRAGYDVMGFHAEVRTNSAEFAALLDRLAATFRAVIGTAPGAAAARGGLEADYLVMEDDGRWEICFRGERLLEDGRELDIFETLDAVDCVEWHLSDQAIQLRNDLLHVHGAALAAPGGSLLLPGKSGIGKTTFALALAALGRERGLRLLSDDVVFLRPDGWIPEAFGRAFHVHDDALPRLQPLGLRWDPEDHIGDHLCVRALGQWDASPGPPLRHVVFPRLDPDGPLALQRLTQAEATLELLRYSKNLRHQPRHGMDMVPLLLSQVECYVLHRNDDLRGAATLVLDLLSTRVRVTE